MHFTREPIIETVVTPREGCKLLLRSSKAGGHEEYFVEAVEVVSFGKSFFFRSNEKPTAFLLPVSDYELLESRDTRMVLKNAPAEKSIKIGGGRDAHPRPQQREPQAEEQQPSGEPSAVPQDSTGGNNDRRGGRRRRGRRGRDRGGDQFHHDPRPQQQHAQPAAEGSEMIDEGAPASADEAKAAPSFISKLFPPPPTLIKETLGRYKHLESSEDGAPPQNGHSPEEGNRNDNDERAEPPFDE